MDSQRSLYDIFSSIHGIAKNREENDESLEPKGTQCMCSRTENDAQEHSKSDTDAHEFEDRDPIYIEKTRKGSRFVVCPAYDPKLNCMLCGGTGHKVFLKNYSLETENGQIVYTLDDLTPHACSCMSVHRVVSLLNQAQIPDKYIHAEMSSFVFDHLNDTQRKKLDSNIQKMTEFCATVVNAGAAYHHRSSQKYFATLFGSVGCGKTLLASAALKLFIVNYGQSGKFVDFQYLLSQLRAEYDERKTGENILQSLRTVDVLIIDKFGKGRNDKEWQLEKLDDLVNFRYNAKKITIITTNYLPQNLRYEKKDIPTSPSRDLYSNDVLLNETFWNQTLPERVGMRMYERILEVSEFFDMTGIPSYRRVLGSSFLDLYMKGV